MLAKDRQKPQDKLVAIVKSEELCIDIINTLNDQNKIPLKKRALVGYRLLDHAINSYESARYANTIKVYNSGSKRERMKSELIASKEMMNVCSDLRLIPGALCIKPDTKWLINLQKKATVCKLTIDKWRESDSKRFAKYDDNDNKNIIIKENPFIYKG